MRIYLILVFILSSQLLQAELKFYSRLGDLPENAQVYKILDEDEDVFVDANSLPPAYRSRITRNTDVYQKVDMSKVIKGKIPSTNGTVSYEEKWYAKEDAELYQVKDQDTVIDISTASESVKQKVKSNKDVFTLIGKAKSISKEQVDELEQKIQKLLTEVVGATDQEINDFGSFAIYKAYQKLEQDLFSSKEKLLIEIERELAELIKEGNLRKVKQLKNEKEIFINVHSVGAFLNHDSYKLKKLARDYQKIKTNSYTKLYDEVKTIRKVELEKGNIAIVEKIDIKLEQLESQFSLDHFLEHRILYVFRPKARQMQKLVFELDQKATLYSINDEIVFQGDYTEALGTFPLKVEWSNGKGFFKLNSISKGLISGTSKIGKIIATSNFSYLYDPNQAKMVMGKWNVKYEKKGLPYSIEIHKNHLATKTIKRKSKINKVKGYWYTLNDELRINWVNKNWIAIDKFSKSKCLASSDQGRIELSKGSFKF